MITSESNFIEITDHKEDGEKVHACALRISEILNFLKQFNSVDDFLIYMINNYPRVREMYVKNYDSLEWKKYKIL